MKYPFKLLKIAAANNNPAAEIEKHRMEFASALRKMFDDILMGGDPEAMLIIAEKEFIRANKIWILMNDDGPDAA